MTTTDSTGRLIVKECAADSHLTKSVFALAAESGQQVWNQTGELGPCHIYPLTDNRGMTYLIQPTIRAIDAEGATLLNANFPTIDGCIGYEANGIGSRTLGPDGQLYLTIYCGFNDQMVAKISTNDGRLLWAKHIAAGGLYPYRDGIVGINHATEQAFYLDPDGNLTNQYALPTGDKLSRNRYSKETVVNADGIIYGADGPPAEAVGVDCTGRNTFLYRVDPRASTPVLVNQYPDGPCLPVGGLSSQSSGYGFSAIALTTSDIGQTTGEIIALNGDLSLRWQRALSAPSSILPILSISGILSDTSGTMTIVVNVGDVNAHGFELVHLRESDGAPTGLITLFADDNQDGPRETYHFLEDIYATNPVIKISGRLYVRVAHCIPPENVFTCSSRPTVYALDHNDGLQYPTGLLRSMMPSDSPPPDPAPFTPEIASISISQPSPSDALLTRGVTFTLKPGSAPATSYEFGWSSNVDAAEPDRGIQTSNASVGRLQFHDVTPDEIWYLLARARGTGGRLGKWTKPLEIRTPPAPLFVIVGDSYNSGHHQDRDMPTCMTDETYQQLSPRLQLITAPDKRLCDLRGGPQVFPNDSSFGWGCKVARLINLRSPVNWAMSCVSLARSGATTASFGNPNTEPGSDSWAQGTTSQVGQMRARLGFQPTSWNIVALSGGANDAKFATALEDYYTHNNFRTRTNVAPWDVSQRHLCPDLRKVWAAVRQQQAQIRSNLQGTIDVAQRTAPGTKIVDVMYPYTVDSSNVCAGDRGKQKGQTSLVDALNSIHESLEGVSISRIDLREAGAFTSDPISRGNLQLSRLYGYPHPNERGQETIARLAASDLLGVEIREVR